MLAAQAARAESAVAPAAVKAAPAELQGVVVTARKPQVRTLIDRKVYDVTVDLQSATGTAVDIFNNIPSVEVDADGNVTLRGDSNVTILVDGKPSAQFAGSAAGVGLQQFPASEIDRIEVMTNPPAQYKVDGSGGVINIITKKTHRRGVSGVVQANLGDKRRYNASANLSYVAGRLSLSGGINLRRDYRHRIVTDDRTAVDPTSGDLVTSHESIRETLQRFSPLVKVGADYGLNSRQSLGGSYSHQELTGHRYFTQADQSATAADVPLSASQRLSDGQEWNKDASAEAHFEQKLWRPDETLTLTYQRTVTRERERYAYDNTYNLPLAGPTHDHLHLTLNLVTTEVGAAYELPMSHERNLKLGYDFEDDSNGFHNFGDTVDPLTGVPTVNSNVTYDFRYHQQIETGYGEYQAPLGPFTLQSGVRVEQTDVHTQLIGAPTVFRSSYFRAYPSVHVDWNLSPASKLSLSLARRINRPNSEALNPFIDYQDIYTLRAGNDRLLPEDVWSYEAGYAYEGRPLNFGLTGYYRFSRDGITDVTQVVSSDVVLVTKANLPKSKSAGLEMTASGHLVRTLSYNLSGNLFYNQIDAAGFGGVGLRSTLGFNAKASLDWRPTKVDTAQVSFSRSDRRLTPQGYVGEIDLVNFGYRRQLTPSLTAILTLSDAFNGQTFRRYVTIPALNDVYQRQQVGQVAYVGFVYAFGASRKAKGSGFDYDQ